jgi:hypothetical protein
VKKKIDKRIDENKDKIAELEAQIDALNLGGDASIMKTDMVDMHNLQYLGNFCMFIGIILVCVLFSVLFKGGALETIKSIVPSIVPSSFASSSSSPSSSSSSSSSPPRNKNM